MARRRRRTTLAHQPQPATAPTPAKAAPTPAAPAGVAPPVKVESEHRLSLAVRRDLWYILVWGGSAALLLTILAILDHTTGLIAKLFPV